MATSIPLSFLFDTYENKASGGFIILWGKHLTWLSKRIYAYLLL